MEQKKLNIIIKNKFEEFLKKKGLNLHEYNKICEENKNKEIEQVFDFLKFAKTKADLKYLIRARDIVKQAEKKSQENDPEFELDDEVEEVYILKVFDSIKPNQKNQKPYIYSEDQHRGNYYSQDVYYMITRSEPWYVACHEYFAMNILDNFDEIIELRTDSIALKGYRLIDIITT